MTVDIPDALGCGPNAQQCGDTCTRVATDSQNCGMCGTQCKANEFCSMGRCGLSCGQGTLRCVNICVDAQSDPGNCGNCGVKCKMGEVCSMGKCAPSCGTGLQQCGNSCVNMQTDRTNCGMCGKMCGAGEECVKGVCQLTCQTGEVQCPNNYGDAGVTDAGNIGAQVCVNTYIDRYNCGSCGKVCPINAPICRFGQCTLPVGPCANNKCDSGSDVTNPNLKWTVCQADCSTAWVSHLTSFGGMYHAEWICKQLGYNKLGQYGGTCNDVCSFCTANSSCNNPGAKTFNNGGTCGNDQYGQILCNTVMWMCTL